MKQISFRFSSIVIVTSLTSLLLTPAAFAATPYNALAQTLSSNTSKDVFNSTDPLQSDKQISGTVWGKNGSTFLIHLPKDDAGYNVLFSKETIITKNGAPTTSKSIVKGVAVMVTGTLDTSTYTIKATNIALGKIGPTSEEHTSPTAKESTSPQIRTATPSAKTISQSLKQGNRGPEVTNLQEKLVQLGFLPKNTATGYYGPQTVKAVQAFQRKHKLSPVGSLGPKTLTLINQS